MQVQCEQDLQWHAVLRDGSVAGSTERVADCVDVRQQQSRQQQQQDVHIRSDGLAGRRLESDPRGGRAASTTAGPAANAERGGASRCRDARSAVLRRRW